jgi:hypothetical protein
MSTFKAPDLHAPRFRRQVMNLLNTDMFNKFLEKHSRYEGEVDLKTFKSVVMTYNSNLKKAAIDNRDGVEMPESLGYLIIVKCDKSKKANLDFASSIKHGQYVTHRNWDSDNYLAKICYSNYSLKYRFADRELWGFRPDKKFRQDTSKAFPEMYQNYIHLTDKTKLSKLY